MSLLRSDRLKEYFAPVVLGGFWLFALMNPLFKKYDYGGGLPLVTCLGVLVLLIAIFDFKEKREKNFWEAGFLIIFSLFFVISFFTSQMRSFGLSEVLAILSVVTVYILFSNKEVEWMDVFLKTVAIGGVFAVIIGFVLYLSRGEVRMFGPFFNKLYPGHVWPNAFALFLLMVWPLYIFYLKKRKVLEISFVLALIFSALLLSFSRGAFLVLCGQFFLFALYFAVLCISAKKFILKPIFVFILTALLTLTLFWGFNHIRSYRFPVIVVSERAGFENHEDLTSKQERIDFWKGAVVLTKERPLLGWGPFSFRNAYNRIQEEFLASADHPHNIFLKFSSENGVIVLLSFLFFLCFWFFAVVRGFGGLKREKKELMFVSGVAVAGAFAHNMIDYNFNFVATILLLFMYMAFMRSLAIKRKKSSKAYLPLFFGIFIAVVSIYEGTLFSLHFMGRESALNLSFFPRYHYLTMADNFIKEAEYDEALNFIDKEISLSPISSLAWYLKGVVYCEEDYEGRDNSLCEEYFSKALELNPMNDFNYYYGYFRELEKTKGEHFEVLLEEIKVLIERYFFYVEYNVHFTSYTFNVEVADLLIDSILPYLSDEEKEFFIDGRNQMLKTSARQRSEKEF